MGASWTRSSKRSGCSAFAEQELARAVRRFGGSYELSAPTRFLEGGGPAVQDIRDNSEPFHCVLRLPLDGGLRGSRRRDYLPAYSSSDPPVMLTTPTDRQPAARRHRSTASFLALACASQAAPQQKAHRGAVSRWHRMES